MHFVGLTQNEAQRRLNQYGPNVLRPIGRATPLAILWRQVRGNFIIYLLLAASILSFVVEEPTTSYSILAVVAVVIFSGFIQEYRSERATEALAKLLVQTSIVRRDGREVEIPLSSVVPGDVLILRTGEKIPADAVVVESKELRVNESVLTGESVDVGKSAAADIHHATPEQQVAMGTFVVYGRGMAVVTHTGMNTKFGQISRSISESVKELPLQTKTNHIAKFMVMVATMVSLATGALMLLRAEELTRDVLVNILILVIALAISAFPEGFPVVVMSTLAIGMRRMAKQNAIVNRMSIIETLGETTVVCSDKTGTITKGEMTVTRIWTDDGMVSVTGSGYEADGQFLVYDQKIRVADQPIISSLIRAGVLCNDAVIERTGEDNIYRARGTTTEAALLVLAAKTSVFRDDLQVERLEEIPFSSDRKMMSVLCREPEATTVYVKGAPELLLHRCTSIATTKGVRPLEDEERARILETVHGLAAQALRTLALATKTVTHTAKDHFEEELTLLGCVAMEDTPREEVADAIATCTRAGILVKVITGDNPETARAVAAQVGLSGASMIGADLDAMTDDELAAVIDDVIIFARVKPEHKLRIVRALKARGHIVTMTGDGVNDAPALKDAHIGIAMGKNGTDVSRSVADLTLKDDNFATIVTAIYEGRAIYKNIQKFVSYQLSCNVAELFILFFGLLLAPWLGWQTPILLALQILFMNLVTDNLPALTLGVNPPSVDLLSEPPRKEREILIRPFIRVILVTSFTLAFFVLIANYFAVHVLGYGEVAARSVALVTLICLEIAAAFHFRSFRKGVLDRSPLINRPLFIASTISFLSTVLILTGPFRSTFGTTSIGVNGWLVALLFAFVFLALYDGFKRLNNRRGWLLLW